jgi:CDP-diacylglycerol---glycerol-3-phosphate 3-phosphatidyltransferase
LTGFPTFAIVFAYKCFPAGLRATLRICNRMNFPNTLTLIRIFLVPVLVVVLWTRYPNWEIIGVAVFLSAAFTDWLDGYWARRKGQITAFGTYLDPVADKLLTAAAFIALVDMQLAPAWTVAVIITREVGVTGLRNLALMRGFTVRVNDVGKAKMGVQVFAITALILGERMPVLNALGTIALWLAMALALISGLQYLRSFWTQAAAHAAAEADLPTEGFSPASSLTSSAAPEHSGGSAGAASLDNRPAL